MAADTRPVFFFDIDNTLYPKSTRVQDMMGTLIDAYFQHHLGLSQADSIALHTRYYKDYGLAIEGLVRHHKVDPLAYNAEVDDALPLETVIRPDPQLRKLIQEIKDAGKVRLWLFTNAYVNHGRRVVKLLGIEDLFEGITFCDYGAREFVCKPHRRMFEKAMAEAGVKKPEKCFFVDDSFLNCKAAAELGWTAAHLVEPADEPPPQQASQFQIGDLQELRKVFPQFFEEA